MNNNIKEPLIFAAGAALGALVTWLSVKMYYRDHAQEAIDSMKEVYINVKKEAIEKAAAANNKPDISVYTKAIEEASTRPIDYTKHYSFDNDNDAPVVEEDDEEYLYEISRGEFADYQNDNTRVTITYFADGIFADEMYEKIDPREYFNKRLIRIDSRDPVNTIDYIRRMSQDEIIIRDMELKLDIDVATDSRTFQDYMST